MNEGSKTLSLGKCLLWLALYEIMAFIAWMLCGAKIVSVMVGFSWGHVYVLLAFVSIMSLGPWSFRHASRLRGETVPRFVVRLGNISKAVVLITTGIFTFMCLGEVIFRG